MAIEEDETLTMYVQESKEHLETIESDLLEIEQGGEAIDEDLVNKVFRAAHSIKGGGSFLGLDHIKELSHKIENVLDMVRNFQLVPSPGLVDTVLKAFDRLGELLDDVLSSNEMEIDDHVTALKEIVTHSMSEAEKSTMDQVTEVNIQAEGPCFKISQFDLNQARRGGKDLYLLEIDLINDVQRQEKTPLDLISSLADVGVILDNLINIDVVGDLDSDEIATVLPMFVLYASVVEPDLLGTLLGLESSKVTLVPKGQEDSHAKIVVSTEDSKDSKKPQAKRAKTKAVKVKASKAKVSGKKEAANIKASENKEAEKKVAVKKPVPEKQPSQNSASPPKTLAKSENLRVPVAVLDQLMNRAGELVLARNELLQAISGEDKKTMLAAGQRINMVTSELQEAIMLTRMQPVGSIFNKFTRVVRDMASDLDKQMSLTIEGSEVELDKSIIEGLGDPLTHLVRNSCDHGIEKPGPRADKGKPTNGKISLRAFHESGQVIIEIEDDGKGLDADKLAEKAISKGMCTEEQVSLMSDKEKTNLIMLPGFSTAETVSDISGRGVGMDVVKTNLDQLGGQVELISEVDKGTTVRIKLPLTLAIIPSLLVENNGERFALPQVNVGELLRIPAAEIRERIEKVGEADVLILRGELIPLLQLNNVLELDQTYYDQKIGVFRPDRRAGLSDQRLLPGEEQEERDLESAAVDDMAERRNRYSSDVSIVILQAGTFRFGLVVEKVHDTVEIVVKPLGRHLKNCGVYAGATIMGDGHVALILDVAGLGKLAELYALAERTSETSNIEKEEVAEGATRQTLLLFHNGPDELCAVPLHLVLRLEQIETEKIQIIGGKKVMQYRGSNMPVYALEEVANVDMLEERSQLTVVIFVVAGREVGLLTIPPLDVIEQDLVVDETTLKQPGISGSAIINNKTTLLVDIFGFMKVLNPDWFEERESVSIQSSPEVEVSAGGKPILLAEDSMFFRAQVKQFIESDGHIVLDFEDGQAAWDYLDANPAEISLVVTDLEMPNLDGFELTKRIKDDNRFSHLKVIALTSLAAEEHLARGKEVGIDDYQIKLDKEKLLQGIYEYLH